MPICSICKLNKQSKSFYIRKYKGKESLRKECKICVRKRTLKYFSTRTNKDTKNERYKKYRRSPEGMWKSYLSSSKQRNIGFRLGVAFFESNMKKPCFYCGKIPTLEQPTGVDRKNSKDAYCLANVVPCCYRCNLMKRDINFEDFINHCKKITDTQNERKV